ncbi:TPA: hypothetical protein MWZ69_002546 [Enterococcus faecium]|nr:hypothetical protein [Enterococcus faecium]
MADKITEQDVLNATNVETPVQLMTAIYNSSSSLFQANVPMPNADNIQAVGAGITRLDVVKNEFISTLVDRIGKVVIQYKSWRNPLKMFKKGNMPLGRTIEEIFIDIAQEHKFNPEESVTGVFKQEVPDVKTLFHEINREGYYKQTIQEAWLEKAFTSWDNFNSFVAGVMNALYTGDEVSEFEYTKLLIANYQEKELFKEIEIGEINAKEFIRKIKATSNKLEFMNNSYNAQGVRTSTAKADQYVIIDADTDATIDVDVLAAAFNMSKTDFVGHKIVIDEFPKKEGEESSNIVAVIVDSEWFMIYDKLYKTTSLYNPEGLYWNYWLHHHQLYSTSQFGNAVAFVKSSTKPVTKVAFASATASVVKGLSKDINITFTPVDATNQQGEVVSSAPSSVKATVKKTSGKATAVTVGGLEVGQSLVTFTAIGGQQATVLVTVTSD